MSASAPSPDDAPEASAPAVQDAPTSPSLPENHTSPPVAPPPRASRVGLWLALLGLVVAAGAGWFAWEGRERLQQVEQELVRRQQEVAAQATEARTLARQAQATTADVLARLSLAEARVAEAVLQRSQLDDAILWLSRARDENLLVDVEAAVRMASQQAQAAGSAQPLVAALRAADDRLARASQPRLEPVRRAIEHDIARIQSVAVADVPTLSRRLDELMRAVDELPLVAATPATDAVRPAPGTAAPSDEQVPWWSPSRWAGGWTTVREAVAAEARRLVRITRIDQPDAVLLAPDEAYFIRENLKLKLLNARVAMLGRHADVAQADLRLAEMAIEKYFVADARRTQQALQSLRQVIIQVRQTDVPRPDETLAALAMALGTR